MAELDDRMRLNNRSIAASYDTARIFDGLGFGHLAPAPHRLVLRQLCSGSIRHFKRRVMGVSPRGFAAVDPSATSACNFCCDAQRRSGATVW